MNCMIEALSSITGLPYCDLATSLPEPDIIVGGVRRGLHIIEFQKLLMLSGLSLSPLYPKCAMVRGDTTVDISINYESLIKDRKALIIGICPITKKGHAFAWRDNKVIDPKGLIYILKDIKLSEIWVLSKLI